MSEPLILAALDQARVTGVAVGRGSDNGPRLCTWDLPKADDGCRQRMFSTFRARLVQLIEVQGVNYFALEKPMPLGGKRDRDESEAQAGGLVAGRRAPTRKKKAFTNPASFEVAWGLLAIAEEVAGTFKVPLNVVDVRSWRAHFLGNGNLNGDVAKDVCLDRCRLLGWRAANHNEAEAAGLWDYGLMKLRVRAAEAGTPLFIR